MQVERTTYFQKFYRVDNSDTRTIGGTGLGLYLCRRLSEAMGGRIWVESEYKKGSTFYVELPRVANDEATRLIEQASIEAEKRIAIEQAQAAEDAAVAANQSQIPQAPANSPAPAQPAFSPVSQPVPVTTASPSPQLNPSSTQNSSMQTPRTINPPITIPPRTRT